MKAIQIKAISLFAIGVFLTLNTKGQILKVQAGTAISTLDWKLSILSDPLYNEPMNSFYVLVGMDYLERKYFNLSSNIGFIQRGGKDEFDLVYSSGVESGEVLELEATLDYLTVNTQLDVQYPIGKKFAPFISFGPRVDYLFSYSDDFDEGDDLGDLNYFNFGLILGGGLKYDIGRIQCALRADYYFDFNTIAEWAETENRIGGEISANTFTVGLSLGYRLKD